MILFKPEHVSLIRKGIKTETRRIWKKQRANVGSEHKAKTEMLSKEYFALLKITAVYQEHLLNITEEGAQRSGGYTRKEYLEKWNEINPKTPAYTNPLVYVVQFKCLPDLGEGRFFKIMTLDELSLFCGYFNYETNVNYGYGCDHQECDDYELDEETGKKQGMCMSFACPLANRLTEDEPDDLRYCEYEGIDPDELGHEDYMLVWRNLDENLERRQREKDLSKKKVEP